jgi:urease accessory protein
MRLIHAPLNTDELSGSRSLIPLHTDRLRLAKSRWRGTAQDGCEFGFVLEKPMRHGTFFFQTDAALYQVVQLPEPVIEFTLPAASGESTRLGWLLGNLHFPVEILPATVRVSDDPAIRQMLLREGIPHYFLEALFQPLAGAHSHGN